MEKFSDRIGVTTAETALQREGMSSALRNSLWSLQYSYIWEKDSFSRGAPGQVRSSSHYGLIHRYWVNYFKNPIDTLPGRKNQVRDSIRDYFFKCEWHDAYNFLEFTAQNCRNDISDRFCSAANEFLAREISAYRFVNKTLTPITDSVETNEIDDAIGASSPYSGAQAHLTTALGHLSDRENPDYRNSIKESISAVESLCKMISSDDKATLGSALKIVAAQHEIHPALRGAFLKLYGYTSDSNGIRHALLDEDNITFDDAKYMLVTCSAFVNYLISKSAD